MIAYLEGQVFLTEAERLTLLVQGVGYELHCSGFTLQQFSQQERAQVWVHTHVREDALMLFGFSSRKERKVFLELNRVNGIGPKSALNILSAAPMEEIIRLIEQGDARGLSKLPKVGKKTAEQIILTLKGQLVMDDPTDANVGSKQQDIKKALLHLGFRVAEVESVLPQLDVSLSLEESLRSALARLT